MNERPILFSKPMVLALLAGTKTQTRRLAKPAPTEHRLANGQSLWSFDGSYGQFAEHVFGSCMAKLAPCPYGAPGERLWVREAWGFDSGVRGDFRPLGRNDLSGMDLLTHTLYRADGGEAPRWRPSIHMPRWASRITLEVTEVRVQRLHDISEEDALAEGCTSDPFATAREHFRVLWDHINGAKAPWSSNPWLWCIGFRRVT